MDIDAVGESDFQLSVARRYGVPHLEVGFDKSLGALVARNHLEFRVGEGPWRLIAQDGFTGGYFGTLTPEDLSAGSPVALKFFGHGRDDAIVGYGPYEFDIDVGMKLVEWSKRELGRVGDWLRAPPTGWKAIDDFGSIVAGLVTEIAIGAEPEKLALVFKIPSPEASVSQGEEPRVRIDRLTELNALKQRIELAILSTLQDSSAIHARLRFIDGTLRTYTFENEVAGLSSVDSLANQLLAMSGDQSNYELLHAQAAARAIEGEWAEDPSFATGAVSFRPLYPAWDCLRNVSTGPSESDLWATIEVVEGWPNRIDPFIMSSGGSFPIPPDWTQVCIQLNLKDGSKTPVRTYTIGARPRPIAEILPVDVSVAANAPRLFVSSDGLHAPDLLALAPPGTVRITGSVDGRYKPLHRSGGWWGHHGLQYNGVLIGSTSFKVVFQLDDSTEIGPIEYDIAPVEQLVRLANVEQAVKTAREIIAAKRIVFDEALTTPEARRFAYARHNTTMKKYWSPGPLEEHTVVVHNNTVHSQSRVWSAVREVHIGPSPIDLATRVDVEYGLSSRTAWKGWQALLPANAEQVSCGCRLLMVAKRIQ